MKNKVLVSYDKNMMKESDGIMINAIFLTPNVRGPS